VSLSSPLPSQLPLGSLGSLAELGDFLAVLFPFLVRAKNFYGGAFFLTPSLVSSVVWEIKRLSCFSEVASSLSCPILAFEGGAVPPPFIFSA